MEIERCLKIKIYELAIKKLQTHSGLCLALWIASCKLIPNYKEFILANDSENISYSNMNKFFPEVYVQKPETVHNENFWFPTNAIGYEERIEILRRAIELLK